MRCTGLTKKSWNRSRGPRRVLPPPDVDRIGWELGNPAWVAASEPDSKAGWRVDVGVGTGVNVGRRDDDPVGVEATAAALLAVAVKVGELVLSDRAAVGSDSFPCTPSFPSDKCSVGRAALPTAMIEGRLASEVEFARAVSESGPVLDDLIRVP